MRRMDDWRSLERTRSSAGVAKATSAAGLFWPLLGSGSPQLRATGPSPLRAAEAQTLNRTLVGFKVNRRELLKLVRQVFQKAQKLLELFLAECFEDLGINRV